MPPFYELTTLDPSAESMKLVRLMEAEATDEDMIIGMCQQAAMVLQWRAETARERLQEAQRSRTLENRKDRVRAKLKGVTAATPPTEQRVQLAPPGAIVPDGKGGGTVSLPAIPSKVNGSR